MAAEQQLLEKLVDIAEPSYQLPWQMPLGGYILLALGLSILAYVSWILRKRWQYLAAKRQAILLFSQLEPEAASQINQLLKRVVQHYAPAHPLLSASTLQWQRFLQQQLPAQPLPSLTTLLYQAKPDPKQSLQFHHFAGCWLKQLRPATLVKTQHHDTTTEVADA